MLSGTAVRGKRLVGFNESLLPRSEKAQKRGQGQISVLKSQKPSSLGRNKLVNGCSVPMGIWRNRSAISVAVEVLPSWLDRCERMQRRRRLVVGAGWSMSASLENSWAEWRLKKDKDHYNILTHIYGI